MPKLDLGLPTYDSLFSTEEERQETSAEKVTTIPIDKITDLKDIHSMSRWMKIWQNLLIPSKKTIC